MSDTEDIFLEDPEKKKGFSVVLKNRDFMKLWIGQFISNMGSSIGSLALMFYAFVLTGSELAMAGLAMVQVIPPSEVRSKDAIFFSPLATPPSSFSSFR